MPLVSWRDLKYKLSDRLIYYPFLRLILMSPGFRAVVFALAGFLLFIALYLPKIWKTTPPDFLPVIKVSGLDLTQAWSLKRSARKAMALKNYDRANYSWQAAMVNDLGDPEAIRGLISNVLAMPQPDPRTREVSMMQSFWLLRLDKTNSIDLELCARLYEKFRAYDALLYTFGAITNLPPVTEAAYIKALFHFGRMAEFEQRLAKSSDQLTDPELPVYQKAFLAGWKSGSEAGAAADQFRAMVQDPRATPPLLRLHMLVSGRRASPSDYAESLARLSAVNEATVLDHVGYWRLLAAANRRDEAIQLAESFSSPPTSAIETVRLAEIFFQLGLTEQCREILKQFAPSFGHSAEVWSTYASVLEDLQAWEEMRSMALQMRSQPNTRDTLGGYSHFLEGRAELAQGRTLPAEFAFRKAAETTYELPALGLLVAAHLTKLKYPEFAAKILKPLESALRHRTDYWDAAFDAALQMKDAGGILKAASHRYNANPTDPIMQNRYAAALMINRARPDESIKLTMQLVVTYPRSPSAVINHCFALLLNNRTGEAKVLLEAINPASLSTLEASAYHLALFEVYFTLKQFDRAWHAADKIISSQLFPVQLQWLKQKQREMPPRVTSAF